MKNAHKDPLVLSALDKGARGERLTREEGLALGGLTGPEATHRLLDAGRRNRLGRHGRRATYVSNLQINPSNICEGSCAFCSYRARPEDSHAYVLEESEVFAQLETLAPTEVHIVGGMNTIWDFRRNLNLIRDIRARYPEMYIKGFTAVEIDYFASQNRSSWGGILAELKDAGLNGLPGGGAEIFSERMRAEHCPEKLSSEDWIEIHMLAHRLGLATNATVLFGMGETAEELVDHLLAIRGAQDASGGFTCFIPLAYQPQGAGEGASVSQVLRTVALARLILDNVPHIKAYWPMIGLETASMALGAGADDLDGTLGQERIAHAAGAQSPSALARAEMESTIRLGGYVPRERLGDFSIVHPVAMIPYANMAPYRAAGAPKGARFESMPPRASTQALATGQVEAACVPVEIPPSLEGQVEYLGSYGIAAKGAVESVFLFSDRPFEEMDGDTALHLTDHSSSSVRLLYLLLGEELGWERLPRVQGSPEGANGELIIGDRALLEVRRPDRRWSHITDLAALWEVRTGHPFVFARWVVRQDAPESLKKTLNDWLCHVAEREAELVAAGLAAEGERLGLSPADIGDYLNKIKWLIGDEEAAGQGLFLEKLAAHGRDPLFEPAEERPS